MFGDVSDPQLVGLGPCERPVDQVIGDLVRLCAPPLGPATEAFQPCTAHEELHRSVADRNLVAQRQLGMHPPGAIGAPRALVDLPDQVGQPDVPDGPR